MPERLRDKNFAAMLEALIGYAEDGGRYSFVSDGAFGKLLIQITVDDADAYTAKHVEAMGKVGAGR
jgi:hypothetical protein